jgi:uncharacterized protein
MRTAIGQELERSRTVLATAAAVGIAGVAADFAFIFWDFTLSVEARGALAVIALGAQIRLANGDMTSVGLRMTPTQGWWFWGRAALLIGFAVLVCVAVGLAVWIIAGRTIPVYATAPGNIGPAFVRMCVIAPVVEETIYRLGLCVPLAVLLGPWRAIAISGLAFAGMHWAYGIPSPENLIGGFFLAWAFLKSESLAVPVALHGLGNVCALASQMGAWYWLRTAG